MLVPLAPRSSTANLASLRFAWLSGEKERAGDYPAPHTLFAALASQQKLTMSAYARGGFPIVPITGDMVARAARTPRAHRPAPSRCIHLRRCALPVARRFTSRKSRDCSRRTTADSPAFRPLHFTHASAAQATQIAVVPFRDRKQSRLPRKSFVLSQKAIAGKRKEPDLRPALFVGLVVRLSAETGAGETIRQVWNYHSHHYGGLPGSARLMAFASLRYANPTATMLAPLRVWASVAIRLAVAPDVCLTSGRPRCGSVRLALPPPRRHGPNLRSYRPHVRSSRPPRPISQDVT